MSKVAGGNAWDEYNAIAAGVFTNDPALCFDQFKALAARQPEIFEPGLLSYCLGWVRFEMGLKDHVHYPEALQLLSEARRNLDVNQNRFEHLRMRYMLGVIYQHDGKTDEARTMLEEGLEWIEEYEPLEQAYGYYLYRMQLGMVYLTLARISRTEGKKLFDQSLEQFDLAGTKCADLNSHDYLMTQVNFELGRVHHYARNLERATHYLEGVNQDLLTKDGLPGYYYIMLRHNLDKLDFPRALECFERLKVLGIHPELASRIYHFAGIAHLRSRCYEDARHCFEQSQASVPLFEHFRELNLQYLKELDSIS
jgi:tetratricopeptide (TPR) repeat protein